MATIDSCFALLGAQQHGRAVRHVLKCRKQSIDRERELRLSLNKVFCTRLGSKGHFNTASYCLNEFPLLKEGSLE